MPPVTRLLPCLLLLATLAGPPLPAAAAPADLWARENLVAWCIVPFDAAKRDPAARAEYVRLCADVLPVRARGLAESVDVYCDEGAFTLAETRAICEGARRAGGQY